MAKRGHRLRLAERVKVARATDRQSRVHPSNGWSLTGEPVKPAWLSAEASAIWDERVATYVDRGQPVRGYEAALAQYCSLEAALISDWRNGVAPKASALTQHRIYASEFFDTPASQGARPTTEQAERNPFERNGLDVPNSP